MIFIFYIGVLPPEMFYKLKDEKEMKLFNQYWEEEKNEQNELWLKIKPVEVKVGNKRNKYVIKTFKTLVDSKDDVREGNGIIHPLNEEQLPFKLVTASPSLDIWGYGVALFALCSGSPLLPTNRDDDLHSSKDVYKAATWTDSELQNEIYSKIKDEAARDLLCQIFKVNPLDRIKSMSAILNHRFFTNSQVDKTTSQLNDVNYLIKAQNEELEKQNILLDVINERTKQILEMNEATFLQIAKTEHVLLRGLVEASDVKVPTCFTILNTELPKKNIKIESTIEMMNDKLSKAGD